MIQDRKRIKSYNQMLEAYEKSCFAIGNRYCREIGNLTQDSLKTLKTLFQSYLQSKEIIADGCQNTKVNSTQQSSNKNHYGGNPNIYAEDYFCPPTNMKKPKKYDDMDKENLQLSKQIKKLSLEHNDLLIEDDEEQQESPTRKIFNMDQLKNKNISEMIMESQRKVAKKVQDSKPDPFEFSESEYEITDHSSNQSSNQGSYTALYKEESQKKPLFGGLFTKTLSSSSSNSISSSSNLLNFNFSSKQLLKSPKKTQKTKRLFVGTKKIPRWAEDLDYIDQQCAKQYANGVNVFGKCVVQNLNTNVIIECSKQGFTRTSSARWNNNFFLT